MTWVLLDLSDERRANKPWLPADDRDVTNGLVIMRDDRPACALHGAMNRVDQHRRIYRCSEFRCGVGAEITLDRPAGRVARPPTGEGSALVYDAARGVDPPASRT